MRKKLVLTLAASAVLALGVATVANAVTTTLRAGNLILKFSGDVSPKALPKTKLAPIGLTSSGSVTTTDGTHPSAFREAVVEIDKNGTLNTTGVPVCTGSQLEARDTKGAKAACGDAQVGSGSAKAEIAFEEQKPLTVSSPLLIFNGGTKGGKTTMFIHTYITVPVPAAIVTTLEVKKISKGPYGYEVVAKVPQIVGGNGSALSFNFKLDHKFTYKGKKQSYLNAKCPTGSFKAKATKILFKNETNVAGVAPTTELVGGIVVPCTPKG